MAGTAWRVARIGYDNSDESASWIDAIRRAWWTKCHRAKRMGLCIAFAMEMLAAKLRDVNLQLDENPEPLL